MKLSRREFARLAVVSATLPAVPPHAWAQAYPTRAITMVVAFGPGGPSDIIARILAEGMRGPLGQPVIIENVTGASGTIGVGRVARAVPDGYTMVLGNWATHVLNGPMFALQYDLQKDFEPVHGEFVNPRTNGSVRAILWEFARTSTSLRAFEFAGALDLRRVGA